MRELIVNADDFGLTKNVSAGIIAAHLRGIVTSTTLMANGRAFGFAVSMAGSAPRLGIGVHLNLREGNPVSPASRIPSLVDARGRLHLTSEQLWAGILKGKVSLSEVERELEAQTEKVIRAGVSPTHLDGHKHMHVVPGVSAIVIRLAQRFGIRSVRCPVERAPNLGRLLRSSQGARTAIIKQYLVGRGVSALAWRFRLHLDRAGLTCTNRFLGLSETGFFDTRSLLGMLGRVSEGATELMCHPGGVDDDLVKTGTRLLSQRAVELQALMAPEVKKFAADRGIQLINYRNLAGWRQSTKAVFETAEQYL